MRWLLWNHKLWQRRLLLLRRLRSRRWRRLRGGPTAIVALFLLLLRWHHLARVGCKLVAIDVLAGVNILILIRVWLLIVFAPAVLILPSLVGVLRLRLGVAVAMSCLAAAPICGDLVIVLASSSLRTTRRWVVPIVLKVVGLNLLLLLGPHTWIFN